MEHVAAVAIRIVAIAAAFGLTVFVHEAGHFISARLLGMAVYEFSIGFGRPLLFWFRRGDTQYSFRLWPFLSFVRIAGMDPGDDHPQGFDKKSRLAQATVLVTGCLMNFLLAAAIYTFMGAAFGMAVATNTIDKVVPGSSAAKAGIMAGDRIVGLDRGPALSVPEIRAEIESHPEKPITLRIVRAGKEQEVTVTPRRETVYDVKGLKLVRVPVGRIGVAFSSRVVRMGVARSVAAGFTETYGMIELQIAGLVGMVMRTVPATDLMGPVGVVHVLYSESKADWLQFLAVAAMLTVAIGFFNLLPVPALDGSRLLIVALEAVRRRPFDKRKENIVHVVGLLLILVLGLFIAYRDVVRIMTHGGG